MVSSDLVLRRRAATDRVYPSSASTVTGQPSRMRNCAANFASCDICNCTLFNSSVFVVVERSRRAPIKPARQARRRRPITGEDLPRCGPADSATLRSELAARGAFANIKPRARRVNRPAFSGFLYRYRNLVERFFNKLKHFRAVATRFEKPDRRPRPGETRRLANSIAVRQQRRSASKRESSGLTVSPVRHRNSQVNS